MRNKKNLFFKLKVIGMAIVFAFMNLGLGSVVAYGKQDEDPNPMAGKVIHFFIMNSEEQWIAGAEIIVSYTRNETNYQHIVYTDASGNATVTVMNDNDEKTFNYTMNMAGYGSVSGSRDENAWGAPVRISLGGIASFSVIFQYYSSYEDNLITVQQTIPYGGSATAPDPTRLGYTFTGWSEDFSNVTSDLTIYATYQANEYSVQYHYLAADGILVNENHLPANTLQIYAKYTIANIVEEETPPDVATPPEILITPVEPEDVIPEIVTIAEEEVLLSLIPELNPSGST